MQKVRCYECGKLYDYEDDGFCPKCGAFNQPPHSAAIGADGSVVRVDGLNERNHSNSFVHAELHEENRERKATGLSKGVKRTAGRAPAQAAAHSANSRKKSGKAAKSPFNLLIWIILAIIAWNFLTSILYAGSGLFFGRYF